MHNNQWRVQVGTCQGNAKPRSLRTGHADNQTYEERRLHQRLLEVHRHR